MILSVPLTSRTHRERKTQKHTLTHTYYTYTRTHVPCAQSFTDVEETADVDPALHSRQAMRLADAYDNIVPTSYNIFCVTDSDLLVLI